MFELCNSNYRSGKKQAGSANGQQDFPAEENMRNGAEINIQSID